MRLLVSGATGTLRRHRDSPHLGVLLVPGAGNSMRSVLATGLPWAADNAAFSGFDPAAFCALLGRLAGRERCLFVACPDVVGDAPATLALFARWQPVLADLGLPVALVAQDGAENLPLPWDQFQALFVGGSTDWKLGPGAATLVAEAKRRGLWVHLGRCNTRKRFRHAFRLGCDSVDGSGFSRWPDQRLPAALCWLADLHGTPAPETPRSDLVRHFLKAGDGASPTLLDLPGWVIDAAERAGAAFLVHAHFAPEPVGCPACGAAEAGALYRHGVCRQAVRDVPRAGRPVLVLVRRRRYRCRRCRRTCLQPLAGLPGRGSLSAALAQHIVGAVQLRTRTQVAREVGIDEKTVRNLLADYPVSSAAMHPL